MRFFLSVTWKDYDGEDPLPFYRRGLPKAAKQSKHTQTTALL